MKQRENNDVIIMKEQDNGGNADLIMNVVFSAVAHLQDSSW